MSFLPSTPEKMADENGSAEPPLVPTESRTAFKRPNPIVRFQGSFIQSAFSEHEVPRGATSPSTHTLPLLQRWLIEARTGWTDRAVQKSAFVEFVATTCLCYLSGLIGTTISNFHTVQYPAYVGVTNIILLTIFIMATAPGSGGHINPVITFATMVTGLTQFSRGVMYMAGQTVGALLAGGLLRGSYGRERAVLSRGGGCFLDPGTVSIGQALVIEIMSTFVLLYLAFGVALDPRQAKLFGPLAGPLAVGCALGLVSFASAGLVPGYAGGQIQPARCLAFALCRGDYRLQWLWWVGPLVGTVVFGVLYRVAPPYHDAPAEAD